MPIKDIGLSRLKLVADIQQIKDSEKVVAELTAKLKNEFGDDFERVKESHLELVRGDYQGTLKLLDVLLQSLRSGVATTGATSNPPTAEKVQQAAEQGLDRNDRNANPSTPMPGPDATRGGEGGTAALQARVQSLLGALGPHSASKSAVIPLETYKAPPQVREVAMNAEDGAPTVINSFTPTADSRSVRCVTPTAVYDIDLETSEVIERVKLEPTGDSCIDLQAEKQLNHGATLVFATSQKGSDEGNFFYAWDATTGELVARAQPLLEGKPGRLRSCALSADGADLAGVLEREDQGEPDVDAALVTDALNEAAETPNPYLPDMLERARISDDGKHLFCKPSEQDRAAIFVRNSGGGFTPVKLQGDGEMVALEWPWGAEFSGNGVFLGVWKEGEKAVIWNAETGERRLVEIDPRYGHHGAVSNDGRILAVSDSNGWLQLYDIDTSEPLGSSFSTKMPKQGGISALRFSPNGTRLFVSGTEGALKPTSGTHRIVSFARPDRA